MDGNKKVYSDDFADIRQELKEKGFNARWFAKQTGFKYCTVNFALAGFPKSELSAKIRREARKFTNVSFSTAMQIRAKLAADAKKLFSK